MRTPEESIARKRALQLLGVAGGSVLLAPWGSASAATVKPATDTTACAVTPEGEIGPFFADDAAAKFNRSNILSNLDGTNAQRGVPLILNIGVRDSQRRCAAVAAAQVDIWHCNASGVYSDESVEKTLGQTWLRGYQITNGAGLVTFTTIVPGWYAGRTTHIHLRVRSAYSQTASPSDGANTTQLFFPQALVDELSTNSAPYRSRGKNTLTNAGDQVYTEQTKGVTLLRLMRGAAGGYTAAFTVDLPIMSG